VHYIPVNHQPYYRDRFKDRVEHFAESEAYYRECLTLPCYPDLEDADVIRVVSAVKDVLRRSASQQNHIGADH
jgi:dTDP-4-amino-4,6-dideoxygalactose transaminase